MLCVQRYCPGSAVIPNTLYNFGNMTTDDSGRLLPGFEGRRSMYDFWSVPYTHPITECHYTCGHRAHALDGNAFYQKEAGRIAYRNYAYGSSCCKHSHRRRRRVKRPLLPYGKISVSFLAPTPPGLNRTKAFRLIITHPTPQPISSLPYGLTQCSAESYLHKAEAR